MRVIAALLVVLLSGCGVVQTPEQKCSAEIEAKTGHLFELSHTKGLGPWDVFGTAGGIKYKCHVSERRMKTSITEVDWRDPR